MDTEGDSRLQRADNGTSDNSFALVESAGLRTQQPRVKTKRQISAKCDESPMKKPPLLNPDQAAKVLQMDRRTLVYWARRGYVPSHPMGEGRRKMWRFVESELVEWVIAQGSTTGRPRPPATIEAAIGARARRIA